MGQKNWGMTLLRHNNDRTMRLPCGKELGSGVHALRGRGDTRNRFRVTENITYVPIGGGGTLHNAGRAVRVPE